MTAPPAEPLVIVSMLAAAALTGCGAGDPERPDLILIVVDTLRADAILGDDGEVWPPHLRSLADDGVVFTECFTHAPQTLPAHVSLFASQPPFRTGVLENFEQVPEDLPLLAEWLGEAGYQTASASSIASLYPEEGQLGRGFDVVRHGRGGERLATGIVWAEQSTGIALDLQSSFGADRPSFLFAHFADPHYPYRAHTGPRRGAEVLLDGQLLSTVETSLAGIFSRELVVPPGEHRLELRSEHVFVIKNYRLEPKFVFTGSFEQGGFRQASKRVVLSFDNSRQEDVSVLLEMELCDVPDLAESKRRYREEVAHVDRHIGELLAELRRTGAYDESLIVFTSDHGEGLGEHGVVQHVENLFDELLRVPLIVKPPRGSVVGDARERLSRRRDRLVRHIDLVPTILDLLALPPLPDQTGTSLLAAEEPVLVAQTLTQEGGEQVCLRDATYKMVYRVEGDAFELYDLETDPRETRDLFADEGGRERNAELRPEWPDKLRAIAKQTALARGDRRLLPPEQIELLRGLGYVGTGK